jgi:hypothetical protein
MALVKRPAKHGARRETIATRQFIAGATVKAFLAHLMVKPLGPLHTVAERLTCFPGPMAAIRALKPSDMQPQDDRASQHGQITDASVSVLFDPAAAPLTVRADEIRISAFEVQLHLVGPDHLADHPEFWQIEQHLDIMEIHGRVPSFWACDFPEFDKESCGCQESTLILYL